MKQSEALAVMCSGKSVFLSGPPGSGKSYVIGRFVDLMVAKGYTVAVTATTGIAANLIGGVTLHSWAALTREGKASTNRPDVTRRLNSADILIIDEISMLGAGYMDMLDSILRAVRQSVVPFGGLQIIACGDFFQLPPVSGDYAFESHSWTRLNPTVCLLSEQFRQSQDKLLSALTALRQGVFKPANFSDLLERQQKPPKGTTYLLTHNSAVDRENQMRLLELKGNRLTYGMLSNGPEEQVLELKKSLSAPEELELRVGARVMFVANNPSAGYVNGTQGRIVRFKNGLPLVETDQGEKILAEAYRWTYGMDDRKEAEVIQIPLRLAWAVTIHKSQGMSLVSAAVDLSRSFSYGMGYVALSRVRSYEGLYLLGINSRSLELDPKVRQYYKAFENIEDFHHASSKEPSNTNYKQLLREAGASKEFIKLVMGEKRSCPNLNNK